MIGFLGGAGAAVLLSVGTLVAMTTFSQTSIERIDEPTLHLEGVDQEYGPETNTTPPDQIAG